MIRSFLLYLLFVCWLQQPQSMLSFEGQQFQGPAAIVEKLKSVGQVKHEVKSMDVQPSSTQSAIIIFVTGAIRVCLMKPTTICCVSLSDCSCFFFSASQHFSSRTFITAFFQCRSVTVAIHCTFVKCFSWLVQVPEPIMSTMMCSDWTMDCKTMIPRTLFHTHLTHPGRTLSWKVNVYVMKSLYLPFFRHPIISLGILLVAYNNAFENTSYYENRIIHSRLRKSNEAMIVS